MPLFSKKKTESAIDYKARLERQLYLAKEDPEPTFDLSACNLKTVTPGTFVLCKVLRKTTLILKNNQLLSLSGGGSFSDLILIETLDISSNKLNKLPDEIKHLRNLKVLKAAHNEIAHLPQSLAQLINLQDLDLSNNCLCTVPDFIANLPSLQHLDISSNPLKNTPNISICSQNSQDKDPLVESIQIKLAGSSPSNKGEMESSLSGSDNEVESLRKMLEARQLQQKQLLAKVSNLDHEQRNAVDKVLERQREQQASVVSVAREENQRDLGLNVNNEAQNSRLAKDILLGEKQEQRALQQLRHIEEERGRMLATALSQQQQLEQSQLAAVLATVKDRNAPLAALVLDDRALQQAVLVALKERTDTQEQQLEQSVADEWCLQQALLAALKEKSDDFSQEIATEILNVQRQLGWLSVCEIRKKEDAGKNLLDEFCEERLALSLNLADLLQRQHKRRLELLDELSHQHDGMEAKLWTMQLQKLLDNVPESLEVKIIENPSEIPTPSAPKLDSPESAQNPSAPVFEECVVCMDAQCEEVFLPCGHICACSTCTRSLTSCPMCRAQIDKTVTIYWPKRI